MPTSYGDWPPRMSVITSLRFEAPILTATIASSPAWVMHSAAATCPPARPRSSKYSTSGPPTRIVTRCLASDLAQHPLCDADLAVAAAGAAELGYPRHAAPMGAQPLHAHQTRSRVTVVDPARAEGDVQRR